MTQPTRALSWSIGALAAAVVLAWTFPQWNYRIPYAAAETLSYALTWGPLVIALAATAAFWRRGVAFRASDLGLGLVIGVIARAAGIVIEFVLSGRMPGAAAVFGEVDAAYVVTAVVLPIVVAPLIEEPFFRGLLQGSLDRVAGRTASLVLASLAFALVHVIGSGWSWTLVLTLLVYAVLAGFATQRTGRLGAAVIAHATLNAVGVLISWPW
jgi:membrane protease YdiL (CAAX protease family)